MGKQFDFLLPILNAFWAFRMISMNEIIVKKNKMFTFANCLILVFLFVATSSKSTDVQHQNHPNFWHKLMKENKISDKQIKQMADEMDEIDPFIEKLSNLNQNSTPNELKHSGKQSLFFNLFKLDNFYELVKGQEEIAKLVQDLAKTFINIKSSLIENGQIEISTILDQTENAVNFLVKQKEIAYEKAKKIKLPEIVKSMAAIWSEMSRIKKGENAKKIGQQIVNLWQSAKQNDEFKKYFGNKSESKGGKNRRRKRVVPYIPRHHSNDPTTLIVIWVLAAICVGILFTIALIKCRRNNAQGL